MLTIKLDRNDENADWLHSLKRKDETQKLLKTRIYLKPQESPPKGITTHRGPRGGLYYETETPIVKPEEIRPVKIDIEYAQDPELFKEWAFANFIRDMKNSINLYEQLRNISDYKKLFKSEISQNIYNKAEKVRHALYRHVKFVIRQHELEKLGKAHVDVKIFRHKIRLFDKVKNAEESLDTISKVSSSFKIDGGCNATQKVRFSNKGVLDAIFKPLEGEYSGIRDGIDTLYNREVCAYELDQLFGLNMVPETVYKTIKGKVGSAQKWVTDAKEPYAVKMRDMIYEEVYHAQIFDYLISNTDRHTGNYLYRKDSKTDKYHLILIDNGCSFSTSDYMSYCSLPQVVKIAELNEAKLIQKFVSIPWSKIQDVLEKNKIPINAIDLCQEKFDLLKKLKRLPTEKEVKEYIKLIKE